MPKPVILTVDDDPEVLRAVQRDLRRHYGEEFRVVAADSGAEALEALRDLNLRNEPVALLLVDQRMPEMTGVQFLAQTLERLPDTKRALLTAYADTEAAISAINEVSLDHYIMKPWDPPEEKLYPVLDDLLEDWWDHFTPRFEGISVIGHRWGRATHEVRAFLARNQIPYRSLDLGTDEEAESLLSDIGGDSTLLPVVLMPDGTVLVQPTTADVANRIGLKTHPTEKSYDLVIVGAGPAGLAAAVYGASEGLATLLVESDAPGGQAGQSSRIENYLGFPKGLSGSDLSRRAVTQATRFGAEILTPAEVVSVTRNDPFRTVGLRDGTEVSTKALLITTGVSYTKLDSPGIEDLTGAGVYYGTSRIEGVAHRGEPMFIIGAGNSAGQAAMFLSRFGSSVTLLVRGESLQEFMSQYLIDAISAEDNLFVRYRAQLVEARGDTHLEELVLKDRDTDETEVVPAGALFIFIGQSARTDWLGDDVDRDERGFILSGAECGPHPKGWNLQRSPLPFETSVPGIFVAGDVRHGSVKRVASSTGEGAMAVRFIHEHLADL
ncbi:MAG TPA: FAD-dependent oxidoreductase [Acidimicrobiia bacterium]|nr:FAD-dependent oxidoreductase [Acidimicrobiia bacterium]